MRDTKKYNKVEKIMFCASGKWVAVARNTHQTLAQPIARCECEKKFNVRRFDHLKPVIVFNSSYSIVEFWFLFHIIGESWMMAGKNYSEPNYDDNDNWHLYNTFLSNIVYGIKAKITRSILI